MSFSFSGCGSVEAVVKALDKAVSGYSEGTQSRMEFENAATNVKPLIRMNKGSAVRVSLNGHATFDTAGDMKSGQCSVSIETLHGFVFDEPVAPTEAVPASPAASDEKPADAKKSGK